MNKVRLGLVCAAFLGFSTAAMADDCVRPAAPTVPNGATASKEEMIAAKHAITKYVAESDSYIACVDAEDAKIPANLKPEEAKAQRMALITQHNAAVDEQQAVATQFNNAVKAYKARAQAAQPAPAAPTPQ